MARLTINIPQADLMELLELGRRSNTSQSQLGTLAIKQLLIRSKETLPLLPPEIKEEAKPQYSDPPLSDAEVHAIMDKLEACF